MRILRRYADTRIILGIIALSGVFLLLTLYFLLPAPAALAQTTCAAGQTYCPSGTYAGQCRPNTVSCPTGSVSATVGGCSTCSCPGGQVVCSGACQVAKHCPDASRATTNQCAASDAASCGACNAGYDLNPTTGLCEESKPVLLSPLAAQEKMTDRSVINVVQRGAGNLLNLQVQPGDGTTRKNVFSVDKTGLMIGWDPMPGNAGIDLGAAGGQNLIFGIAKQANMDPLLDALLLLQTRESDGNIVDRVRVTGTGDFTTSGDFTALGKVHGSEFCIGASCKSAWPTVEAISGVKLQADTPGAAQTGNFNVSGTGTIGSLTASGDLTLGSAGDTRLTAGGANALANPSFYIDAKGSAQIRLDSDEAVAGKGAASDFRINNGANTTIFKVNENGNTEIGSLPVTPGYGVLRVRGGVIGGSSSNFIINNEGKIPGFTGQQFNSLNASALTDLNASEIRYGQVPDSVLSNKVVKSMFNGDVGCGYNGDLSYGGPSGPWLQLFGGASVLQNVALQLTDLGTADGNINILSFNHGKAGNPSHSAVARIKSTSIGTDSASGAKLALETTQNNLGTWNTDQLVLNRDGKIGVGTASPASKLDVQGGTINGVDPNLWNPNTRGMKSTVYGLLATWTNAGEATYNLIGYNKGDVRTVMGPIDLTNWENRPKGVNSINVNARFNGWVKADYNETYTFHVLADDGVRLWVNNVSLVDYWDEQWGEERIGTIALTAGTWYPIVLEYFQRGGGANLTLKWSSSSVAKALIPSDNLQPPDDVSWDKVVSGINYGGGGNVGIGTAGPDAKLDVDGTIETNGFLETSESSNRFKFCGNGQNPASCYQASELIAGKIRLSANGGFENAESQTDPGMGGITAPGNLIIGGNITANNTYECVNVESELRCNLRSAWRTADKTSGFVESWVGDSNCTTICNNAGLRACTDIQYSYECPNGTLVQGWGDDPSRNCSSTRSYRWANSGVTCTGQSGTGYERYRCRCAS